MRRRGDIADAQRAEGPISAAARSVVQNGSARSTPSREKYCRRSFSHRAGAISSRSRSRNSRLSLAQTVPRRSPCRRSRSVAASNASSACARFGSLICSRHIGFTDGVTSAPSVLASVPHAETATGRVCGADGSENPSHRDCLQNQALHSSGGR